MEIDNAMTPDEWEEMCDSRFVFWRGKEQDVQFEKIPRSRETWATVDLTKWRHRLAALSLKDQSFGFTHEDVDLLRNWDILADRDGQFDHATIAKLESLAGRIAALLPPAA